VCKKRFQCVQPFVPAVVAVALLFNVVSHAVYSATQTSLAQNNAEKLVDPTRPPGQKSVAAAHYRAARPGWVLSSTLIAADRRLARINGRMVTVGQVVNGATVTSIDAGGVWLKNEHKSFRIKLLAVKIKEISQTADN